MNSETFKHFPVRVMQFGEGNFLRAFVDWMMDIANERANFQSSIVIVQPIEAGRVKELKEQNCDYHLFLRGIDEDNEPKEIHRKITSVRDAVNPYEDFNRYMDYAMGEDLRFVVSNTTESGIAYVKEDYQEEQIQKSFPAKITQLLYRRFLTFQGAPDKGLVFLPVELIDNNGTELHKIVLQHAKDWQLSEEFISWVEESNTFCNTLVDRIVTGYSKELVEKVCSDWGELDNNLDTAELFHLWVIESDRPVEEELPLAKIANVVWTDNAAPYKMRKVRILNGGHTSTVPASVVAGKQIVREWMEDSVFYEFLHRTLVEEVIPTIPMVKEELLAFAKSVEDRFRNPYIDHKCLDITLNSVSKFKVRCLVSLKDFYQQQGKLPERLSFSLAALLRFYQCEKRDDAYWGTDDFGTSYPIRDDEEYLAFFETAYENRRTYVEECLKNIDFWGEDLTQIDGLLETVNAHYEAIVAKGMKTAMEQLS